MKRDKLVKGLALVRENSKPRKFIQSVEMMVNFSGLDMKKPSSQFMLKVNLPHATGKSSGKILVFAKTQEFADSLKEKVDVIIMDKDIEAYAKNKKKVAELINFDALFAEGPAMLTVAKFMGQQLAPKGKMPKPILNLNSFDETVSKAKTQTTITNRKGKAMPVAHVLVGRENMKDIELADNMMVVFDSIVNALPQKRQNIKSVYVKTSMGKPVKLGDY